MEKVMKPETMWRQFETLPTAAKREIIDFIAFLQIRYERRAPVKSATKSNLKKEPFIGTWKDRDDLKNSVSWVRDLRRKEWKA
jgi:hypothetical protein